MVQLGPRRGGGPMSARLNAEKPKHTKKTILRLLRYIGKSGILLLILLGIMLAVTLVMQYVVTKAHAMRTKVANAAQAESATV